jgi:hypothetical protein
MTEFFDALLSVSQGASFRAHSSNDNDIDLLWSSSRVSEACAALLSSHALLERVTLLDLSASKLAASSLLELLAQTVRSNRLKKLVLSRAPLTTPSVRLLLDWLREEDCSLQVLFLDQCGLSCRNRGDELLVNAHVFPSLRSLSVGGNAMHQSVELEYLELARCTSLRQLSLEHMPVGTNAAFMLGFALRVSSLQSVNLSNCRLADEQLRALVDGFLYFDAMTAPPVTATHCHPPIAYLRDQRLCADDDTDNSFREHVVDGFCEEVFPSTAHDTARGGRGGGGGGGEERAADTPFYPPLLLDLNLSYNHRVLSPALLAPLLTGREVGLGCLLLAGNRCASADIDTNSGQCRVLFINRHQQMYRRRDCMAWRCLCTCL